MPANRHPVRESQGFLRTSAPAPPGPAPSEKLHQCRLPLPCLLLLPPILFRVLLFFAPHSSSRLFFFPNDFFEPWFVFRLSPCARLVRQNARGLWLAHALAGVGLHRLCGRKP